MARDDLRLKTTTLSQVCQEVAEAERTVRRLNKKCHGLRDDLQRQQALVSQKEGVIVELRDKACTLWASEWLAFRRKASKVFPGLSFNFLVPAEDEVGESDFDAENGLGVSSTAPSSALLPGNPEIEAPAEAGSLTLVAGTSPSDLHGLEVRVIEAAQSPASDI